VVSPRTLQRWSDVETESDFIAYLELLVADVRDPSSRWSSRDVPGFLHAWARWIDDALAQGTAPEPLEAPSRRALAGQLFHARTAVPPSAVGVPTITDPERVASVMDLAGWLRHLAHDCLEDDVAVREERARGGWAEGRWAHGTDLPGYLDAWHACLRDHSAGGRRARFKARTWAEVADALTMGQIYE
jgi:hypothetical protein